MARDQHPIMSVLRSTVRERPMRHVIGIQRSIPQREPQAVAFLYFSHRHSSQNNDLALVEVGVPRECGESHSGFCLPDELAWNRVPSAEATSCEQARRHEGFHKPERRGASSRHKSHLEPHHVRFIRWHNRTEFVGGVHPVDECSGTEAVESKTCRPCSLLIDGEDVLSHEFVTCSLSGLNPISPTITSIVVENCRRFIFIGTPIRSGFVMRLLLVHVSNGRSRQIFRLAGLVRRALYETPGVVIEGIPPSPAACVGAETVRRRAQGGLI